MTPMLPDETQKAGLRLLGASRITDPSKLDAFTLAYVRCALWSSNDWSRDDGGDPLDDNYSAEDIAPETLFRMAADCAEFRRANAADLEDGTPDAGGHDFWLTRNGHGCGFWDGDWPEASGERLTAAAKRFGTFCLYVGDDGRVYGS